MVYSNQRRRSRPPLSSLPTTVLDHHSPERPSMNTNHSPSVGSTSTQLTISPISNIPELSRQSMSHVPNVPTVPPPAHPATRLQTTITFPSPKRKCLMSHVPD